MHRDLVHAQDSCARTRFLCMRRISLHAQDLCACTGISCIHEILAHAQKSCACVRFLCMQRILVHAQDSCACAGILCMPFKENRRFVYWFSRGILWYRFLGDFGPKSPGKAQNDVIMGGSYSQTPYGDFWTDCRKQKFDEKRLKSWKRPAVGKPFCLFPGKLYKYK